MELEKDAGPPHRILGRSVKTQKWCYAEWDGGQLGAENYDVASDPRELNNRATVGQLAEVKHKLRVLLREPDPTAR